VDFYQVIQWFYPHPVFEALRFFAFSVSCVLFPNGAYKSIRKQSMPGAVHLCQAHGKRPSCAKARRKASHSRAT